MVQAEPAIDSKAQRATDFADERATDLALRRYDVIFRYLAYENTVFWTRSQFFGAAQLGLLIFAGAKLPSDPATANIWGLIMPFIITGCGVLLTLLWASTLKRAQSWIDHWHALCIELESTAFGQHFVLRETAAAKSGADSIKKLARCATLLFFMLWGSIAFYLGFCVVRILRARGTF